MNYGSMQQSVYIALTTINKSSQTQKCTYSVNPYIQNSKQMIVVTLQGNSGERTWKTTIKGLWVVWNILPDPGGVYVSMFDLWKFIEL